MTTVRIGALAPLSRPGWVEAGRHLLAGLELATHEVNAAGGIAGSPLELVVRDTAADPARAEAAVDEFAALGVAAVAGEYHSVVARAAAARADALGLRFLCSSAVLDNLTDHASDRVARIAPPQSRGWRRYATFLRREGHTHAAVVAQPSLYWETGTRILRDHLTVTDLSPDPTTVCDHLADSGATALLLLVGHPDPAMPIVRAVRGDRRLSGVLLGAPAGQPEFAEWVTPLGAGVPFLRYLPGRLTGRGTRAEQALTERLGGPPSFVAYEGHDTITVLAAMLRTNASWAEVAVDGTRGRITFSRAPGIGVWQWTWPDIQIADRAPEPPHAVRVLDSHPANT